MPARVEACSIVIEQMLPSLSTSRIVFSSRSRFTPARHTVRLTYPYF